MLEDKNWCVYIHISPSNKAYIGITSNTPEGRWQNGLGYLKKTKYGEYKQPAIARAIIKYGWDNFEHIIWANQLTKEQACQCERLLILLFNTRDKNYGYNIREGGNNGGQGRVVSEMTRYRLSISHKGKESPNKNKRFSDEHRQKLKEAFLNSPNRNDEWRRKISQSKKGKKMPQEIVQRMSESRMGHAVSEETRKKISQANTGRIISGEWANKIGAAHRKGAIVCIETGVIYDCAYTIETQLGIKNVRRACDPNSGRHTAGGYHWRYATEEEIQNDKCVSI
ncbi:MAG: NUMOD3 domain-containing DNA-binding protein [Erysipelotrichaceae bacterium]